jgi:hypothetical protein
MTSEEAFKGFPSTETPKIFLKRVRLLEYQVYAGFIDDLSSCMFSKHTQNISQEGEITPVPGLCRFY